MSDNEPTLEEMLTVACLVAFEGRRMIENTNRSLPAEMMATLDTLYGQLSVVGGAMAKASAHLEVQDEVERQVAERIARARALRSRMGPGGTA